MRHRQPSDMTFRGAVPVWWPARTSNPVVRRFIPSLVCSIRTRPRHLTCSSVNGGLPPLRILLNGVGTLQHIILGTAGHVDHGKTTLVRYLTGVDTDRLQEEKARGITIDLGFAPFLLPGGQRVGIVDVPGHERFVRHMLAGATGVDLVLFVIAANEGIMPQTREHMDILRLLGVNRGVVALTKIDMVEEDWLALVREEVLEYLADSPLQSAPVVELSSVTGEGIPALLDALGTLCAQTPERSSAGICRLAVDRVFTMTGFGTVVTGTLWSGTIRPGDSLELLPSERQARVRSLQVHGESREEAWAGERVAVNLTGLDKALVERGSWLATPGALRKSHRVDVRLELLPGAPKMERHARVHVHHGTAEALARVNLLDRDVLMPGESCYAQLELETPLAMLSGDRVILRFYSPLFTIGGATVLHATAVRHRRAREEVLRQLASLDSGDPRQVLLASMSREGVPWQLPGIAACLRIEESEAAELAQAMAGDGELLLLPDAYYFPAADGSVLQKRLDLWLTDYLRRWPLRVGAPKQEAAQVLFPRMGQREQRAYFQYLDSIGHFAQDEKLIWPEGWAPIIHPKQASMIEALRKAYGQAPYAPPAWSEAAAVAGVPAADQAELYQWFLREGELVAVGEDIPYAASALTEAERLLRGAFPDGGFTLAEARDLLGTSRKNAQQISEYFDQIKRTYRDGEKRFWRG